MMDISLINLPIEIIMIITDLLCDKDFVKLVMTNKQLFNTIFL